VACCQGGKLRASDGEQGAGSDEKCVRPFALEWGEGGTDLTAVPGIENLDLQAYGARC